MADCELFGLDAAAHHRTSVLLHAASAVVLFLWLAAITRERWKSLFVAGVFALHPLHVESVAWAAERKDVLSTLLGLLSLAAWTSWTACQPPRPSGTVMFVFAVPSAPATPVPTTWLTKFQHCPVQLTRLPTTLAHCTT